jgi:hypothetical protein
MSGVTEQQIAFCSISLARNPTTEVTEVDEATIGSQN